MSAAESSGEEMEVQAILGERKDKKGQWFLVQWAGYGPKEATWEKSKNLLNANAIIENFHKKVAQAKQKKTSRKSSSRSRSRSRSRGRSRSGSRSPARSKKTTTRKSSRSRKAEVTKTVTETSSPKTEEVKTETVSQSPGRFELKTEVFTKSVATPSESYPSSYVTRTSETKQTYTTSTTSSSSGSSGKTEEVQPKWRGWMQGCCQQLEDTRQGLASILRSDYTALVVFSVISIIMLSFVLEKNVNFPELCGKISAFFVSFWVWLKSFFPK